VGWCSGTEVIDKIMDEVLESSAIDDSTYRRNIIAVTIKALWDHDWDCESDSEYFDHPLVHDVLLELDPEMFENK